jgi:chemotaxis protein CheD
MTESVSARTSLRGARTAGLPHVFLLAGEMLCTAEPMLVTTVLGSCVAVCLFDRARGLGGINHFLLPRGSDRSNLRYGNVAIDNLVDGLIGLGAEQATLEAKMFGGAAVLLPDTSNFNVGLQNIDVALERLERYRIPIIASRIGGKTGLTIRLFTRTGRVLVRQFAPMTA